LGYCVKSKEELSNKVNNLFDVTRSDSNKKNVEKTLPKEVLKKIYLDRKELAAEKMIKIWENLAVDNNISSNSINWILFKLLLKLMKFNGMIGRILRSLSSGMIRPKKGNFKFPSLKKEDVCERINRLKHILGIDEKIECKLLSDRTILIKRHK